MDHEERARLARLGAFADLFEAAGFTLGRWGGGGECSPGVRQMPFFALGETASALHELCYKDAWVLSGFDWSEWMQSPEATTIRDDPGVLAAANAEQLAMLLTVLMRQMRFCEGSLADAFETGLLTGILRRAKALASGDGHAPATTAGDAG